MNMKKYKRVLTLAAPLALKATKIGANTCCFFITYQPEFPTKLRKKD